MKTAAELGLMEHELNDQVTLANEVIAELIAEEAAGLCCPFHEAGGTHELACGGDLPNESGRHTRTCSYHFGADCSCGARVYSGAYLWGEEPTP